MKITYFVELTEKDCIELKIGNLSFFNPEIVPKLSEIWVGSGIRDQEKTYSTSRIQGSKKGRWVAKLVAPLLAPAAVKNTYAKEWPKHSNPPKNIQKNARNTALHGTVPVFTRLNPQHVGYTCIHCCGSGPGIRCLFNPWMRDPGWAKVNIRIRDEHFGSYFRELRNNFWVKISVVEPEPEP